MKAVDGSEDAPLVGRGGGFQDRIGVRAIDHDADLVREAEFLDQQMQRSLDQPQPVLAVHRARDVDDKGQHGVLAILVVNALTLDADAQQVILCRSFGTVAER